MFENIGGKIKTLATVICIIGIIASVVYAFILWGKIYETFWSGLGILVGGALASWIGSFFMYGFGELIEKTSDNNELLQQLVNMNDKKLKNNDTSTQHGAVTHFSVAPTPRRGKDRWTCEKCGAMNSTDARFCQSCKEHR